MALLAGIEAGGTKFVCGVGDHNGKVFAKTRIPTGKPSETMREVNEYLRQMRAQYPFEAIGIGCFGPIDPNQGSKNFGHITTSAKTAWQFFDIVGAVKEHFDLPIGFDTDVNAAALGEAYWGVAKGLQNFIYLTVGTGIGGGAMVNGELLHGGLHPEMGHCVVPRAKGSADFAGVCPCHGDCLEGLASGPAIKARWQVADATELPQDHPAWDEEAHYLGHAISNFIFTLAPERIILGGGVMGQEHLFPKIRQRVREIVNGYVSYPKINDLEQFITAPGLNNNSGLCGSLALAAQAKRNLQHGSNNTSQSSRSSNASPVGELSNYSTS